MFLFFLPWLSFVFAETNPTHPQQCLPTELDWDKMVKLGPSPKTSIEFTFNTKTFVFDFKVELEYIGSSTSRTSFTKLGTNYIIDFVSFTATDSINKPNNCANRISSSYENSDWDEWWQYSASPWIDQHIGSDKYLAYGTPSKYWTISYIDINYNQDYNPYTCGVVLYHGHFSLSEIMNCSDKNGFSVIHIEQDENYYYLSGKLFVSIVSPIGPKIKNFYKVYNIDAQAFQIKIQKTVGVVNITHHTN